MTILDPAPSTAPLGIDQTSLSTPFSDETEDRTILDFDAIFASWNNVHRLSQLNRIPVFGVADADDLRDPTGEAPCVDADLFLPIGPLVHSDGSRGWDRLDAHLRSVEAGFHVHINEALQELEDVDRRVEENALTLPSVQAHSNARILIPRLCRLYPRRLSVYPLFDGEIAIEATVASRHSVLLSCEPDGSVLCLVNIRQRRRRAKYDSASELPDRFIGDALLELGAIEA